MNCPLTPGMLRISRATISMSLTLADSIVDDPKIGVKVKKNFPISQTCLLEQKCPKQNMPHTSPLNQNDWRIHYKLSRRVR
jgi:hypothetical protein